MPHAEVAVVHNLLVAGAGLDGLHLFGFQRSNVVSTFVALHWPDHPLVVSSHLRPRSCFRGFCRTQVRASNRVRDSGVATLAGDSQTHQRRHPAVALVGSLPRCGVGCLVRLHGRVSSNFCPKPPGFCVGCSAGYHRSCCWNVVSLDRWSLAKMLVGKFVFPVLPGSGLGAEPGSPKASLLHPS